MELTAVFTSIISNLLLGLLLSRPVCFSNSDVLVFFMEPFLFNAKHHVCCEAKQDFYETLKRYDRVWVAEKTNEVLK